MAWGHPSSPIPHPSLRRQAQLGFGLGLGNSFTDLMIPAVIIGIIVVIAVPAHSDYRARARVSEGLAVVDSAKAAIEKTFAARGPTDMSRRSNTGWIRPAFNEHLQSLAIAKDGTITLQFAESVAPQTKNQIQIVPVSGGRPLDLSKASNARIKFDWQCGGPAGKTTLPENYRPKNCRPQ